MKKAVIDKIINDQQEIMYQVYYIQTDGSYDFLPEIEHTKKMTKKRMVGNEMQLNKEAVKLLKEKHEKLKQKAFQMKSNVKNFENAEKLFMEIVMELQE